MLPKEAQERHRKGRVFLWERNIIGTYCKPKCKRLDTNNYTTSMIGLKYKLAHKRADRNN